MNRLDTLPLTTIGAIHGVCFGGGFELALTCDILIADKTARFCFPELRLGIVPGFGGIPRLKRDVGNGVVRDLLLTGRSLNAKKAQTIGLVSQMVAQGKHARRRARRREAGHALRRRCHAHHQGLHEADARTRSSSSRSSTSSGLRSAPWCEAALKKFVESTDLRPYLP